MNKYKVFNIIYTFIAKPLLFKVHPDIVHTKMVQIGYFLGNYPLTRKITKQLFHYNNKKITQTIKGMEFKNPVGLSAGFDKDGDLVQIIPSVGFGFQQVGTVTYKPYKGNKPPWNTRLPKNKSIAVNYGLKNSGVENVLKKISRYKTREIPLSISVGKTNSKETADDAAGIQDCKECYKAIVESGIADFITINISCPNTFGGEPFTEPNKLDALLNAFSTIPTEKPVFLKMPINLEWAEYKSLCDVALKYNIAGVIIGNLNKDRNEQSLVEPISPDVKGNLSGKPTQRLSNELISKTYKEYGKKLVIIGVGGIFSAEDAYEKIRLGASLVQLITGMIYEGPQLIGDINRGLVELLEKDGFENISEAVGTK